MGLSVGGLSAGGGGAYTWSQYYASRERGAYLRWGRGVICGVLRYSQKFIRAKLALMVHSFVIAKFAIRLKVIVQPIKYDIKLIADERMKHVFSNQFFSGGKLRS